MKTMTQRLEKSVLVFFLLLLVSVPLRAQAQGATDSDQAVGEDKIFDVITIKKSGGTDGGMGLAKSTPDSISIMHSPLRSLIAHAYGIKPNAIVGGPSWLESEEFDIEAKVLPDANGHLPQLNREEIEVRIRTMLRDRFHFASHFETRKVQAYELSIGSGGSKLKAAIPGNSYVDGVKGPDGRTGSGLRIVENHVFTGQAIPIAEFADTLSNLLDRTVIDLTNLTGRYDITFHIPFEPGAGANLEQPSYNTVLGEELGLRLKLVKREGKVLVIDRIQEPSSN